uniref:RING-type E3 ubiquitin transferase n=1 Tax=Ascaris lumbricoides TaxID=6252 RepID=A0A9J2P223_ASCLU
MVSARGEGAVALFRRGGSTTHMRLTAYERARKPHQLRTGVDTRTVRIEWIASELTCGLCKKTIQNAMVIRNCMHRFCADCILPKIHTGTKKCPLCKKVLPKKTPLKSDANFDSVINKFAMTPERRCLKRSISESNNLSFAKRRLFPFDKKTPTKRASQSDIMLTHASPQQTSPSKVRPQVAVKPESVVEVSSYNDVKPTIVVDSRSETSEPSLVIDDGGAIEDAAGLSQPTSSNTPVSQSGVAAVDEQTKSVTEPHKSPNKSNTAFVVQRGSVVNFSPPSGASLVVLGTGISIDDETSKRLVASGHCDAPPIIVLQNSPPSGRLNGFESAKMNAGSQTQINSRASATNIERGTKYVPIQPHPGAQIQPTTLGTSSNDTSNVSDSQPQRGFSVHASTSNAQTPTTSQGSQQPTISSPEQKSSTVCNSPIVNGIVVPASRLSNETNVDDSTKNLSRTTEDSTQMASPCGASISSPSDYLFLPPKQRMSIGIEAELVLYPEASVTLDKKLPDAAKRPRFVVTYPGATVGHLCEYIMQRIAVESGSSRLKKRRVSMCAVKTDLCIEDVLVVSETGEGQFTTLNVRGEKCDSQSSSVFTITSPFSALDDLLTVEKLRADHWANKKRPLRLIFKFVPLPPSGK